MSKERNTAQRQKAFLDAVERGASVSDAAKHAGVARSTVYEWAAGEDGAGFKERWELAESKLVRQLRNRAFEVAMEGNTRMLIFLLQHYDKATFGEGVPGEAPEVVTEIMVEGLGGQHGGDFISYEPAHGGDGERGPQAPADGPAAPLGAAGGLGEPR